MEPLIAEVVPPADWGEASHAEAPPRPAEASPPARLDETIERLSLYLQWPGRVADSRSTRLLRDIARRAELGPAGAADPKAAQAMMREMRQLVAANGAATSAGSTSGLVIPIPAPPISLHRMPEQHLTFWSAKLLLRRMGELVSTIFSDPLFKDGYGR